MVNVVHASIPIHYRVTVRPRSALREGQEKRVLWLFLPFAALIAIGVGLFGALPVLPPGAVVGVGLAWACDHAIEHCGDYERLTLSGKCLVLESRNGEQEERVELNSLWTQVVSRDNHDGGSSYLALRFQGKEINFGRNLTDRERASVCRDLRRLLTQLRT